MTITDIFKINPNPVAIAELVCTSINIFLIIYIVKKKLSTTTIFWFIALCFGGALMGISEAMYLMSANETTYSVWLTINNLPLTIIAPIILLCTISFVGKESYLKKIWIILPILWLMTVIMVLFLKTNFLFNQSYQYAQITPWGRLEKAGQYPMILPLYYFILGGISIWLLINFYLTCQDKIRKIQTRLFIIGLSVPLIGGPFFQGVVPVLLKVPAFPSAIFLQAIQVILVAYSLIKYGIATFNESTTAEKLLQLIPNPVLLLNTQKNIEHINPSTNTLLQYKDEDLIGQPIKKLFDDANYNNFESEILLPLTNKPIAQIYDLPVKKVNEQTIAVDIQAINIKKSSENSEDILLILTNVQPLKDQTKQLEEKLKEIEQQKTELERLNKIMVGRQESLENLKKENEKLKKTTNTDTNNAPV